MYCAELTSERRLIPFRFDQLSTNSETIDSSASTLALLKIRYHCFLRYPETFLFAWDGLPEASISVSVQSQAIPTLCTVIHLEVFKFRIETPLDLYKLGQSFQRNNLSQHLIMFPQAFLPLLLAPLIVASPTPLDRRQFISANDLTTGKCKDTMFLFARGSTEIGNMVRIQLICKKSH